MLCQQFRVGNEPHTIEAALTLVGSDICLCVGGGSVPHVGAVALAEPRVSLADASKPSASASVLCVTGHKDDELARSLALELATRFACRVEVSVGLHIDQATPEDIHIFLSNVEALLTQISDWLAV
jgi:hypothetical protein